MQPMDVAVFHPLKNAWKKAVYSFRIGNTGLSLKRDNFCPILNEALKCISPDILKNGFRRCGLCPINADALDYTQLPGHSNVKRVEHDSDPNILDHLKFFEKYIPAEKLEQFKSSEGTWTGALEDTSLFNFWKSMKSKIVTEVRVGNAALNPVIATEVNDLLDNPDVVCDSQSISLVDPQDVAENNDWWETLFYNENEESAVLYEYDVTHTGELVRISAVAEKNEKQDQTESLSEINKQIVDEEKMNGIDNNNEDHNGNAISTKIRSEIPNPVLGILENSEHQTPLAKGASGAEIEPLETTIETTILEQFPTPFQKALFWPSASNITEPKRQKRKPKDKVPSVATSQEWRNYHSKKEKEKVDKIKKTEENKRKRIENAEKKKEREAAAKKKKDCKENEVVSSEGETSTDNEVLESGDEL